MRAIAGSTRSSLMLTLLLRHSGTGIGAEHLDELAARLERADRRFDARLARVPVDIDEEDVVPQLLARRARLDPRQVEAGVGQRLQHAEQDARRILEAEQDRRL